MSRTNFSAQILKSIAEFDLEMSQIFAWLKFHESPLRSPYALSILLQGVGLNLFGLNAPNNLHNMLQMEKVDDAHVGPVPPNRDPVEQLKTASAMFKSCINETSGLPKYMAANYWSPWDDRRRTVQVRYQGDESFESLASACLFYALTLKGASDAIELYSTTHFVVERAKRRRPFRVSYSDELPDGATGEYWHIPASIHTTLLDDFEIPKVLRQLLNSVACLPDWLRSLLENTAYPEQERIQAEVLQMVQPFFEGFDDKVKEMPKDFVPWVEKTLSYVKDTFDTEIDMRQALFMLLTNVVYNTGVCETQQYYGFPVQASKACCVMTIGTNEPLGAVAQLAVSRIVESVFVSPLIADYRDRQRAASSAMDDRLVTLGRANPAFWTPRERRITAAFWDIRGFSMLSKDLVGAEYAVASFLMEYNNKAVAAINRYSGVVDKFIGDGVMALFGIDEQESDAEAAARAICAADELRKEFDKLLSDHHLIKVAAERIGKGKFGLGCGILSGRAIVGRFGEPPLRYHFTALGALVNLASRIESKAEAGEILFGHDTYLKLLQSQTKQGLSLSSNGEFEQLEFKVETKKAKYVINARLVVLTRDVKNIEGTHGLWRVSGVTVE